MNVVDSLVVTLGLNAASFTQGQAKVRQDLKVTKESANTAAKEIAASGATAAQFFGKMRNEALSLAAVFLGGMGLKAFVSTLTTADAALGRASKNLGISTELLSAWGQVAARNGGTTDGMVTSFQSLNEQLQLYNRTGQSSITPLLQRLGVNSMSELEDLPGVLTKIAGTLNNEIASGRTTRGQAVSLLGGLGLDPGIINAMLSGTRQFAQQIREALALGVPTEKDTNAAIALEQAFEKTKQAAINLGRTILTDFTPTVTAALENVDKWLAKDENREWLNAKITEVVETIKHFVAEVDTVVTALGGWKVATEILFGLWIGSKFIAVIANITRLLTLLSAVPGSGVTAALLTRLGVLALPLALKGDTADNQQARDAEQAQREGRGDQWRRDNPNLGDRLWNWITGGTSGGGGRLAGPRAGGAPTEPSVPYQAGDLLRSSGATSDQYNAFKDAVAGIEHARYDQMGGSSNRFAGRYQMGEREIAETARRLFVKAPTREEFLANPAMQERFFEAYTQAHHEQLMRTSSVYRAMSPAQRLAVLGYAHNQGAGGASEWLRTGQVGRDAFGTGGDAYVKAVQRALAHSQERTAPNGTGPQSFPSLPDPSLRPRPGPPAGQVSNNDNSRREVTVGTIQVHTAATDAKGIARGIGPALEHAALASQANFGLA